ncbi:DUF2085 domain-containing protein [Oscillibacter ruminantium]|nr:DUF2085 domain-containing protein [Oscillibacter ruminantium]
MRIGKLSGCHQRADRSFFWRGNQFPVCARCTGVFFGQFCACFLFQFCRAPFWIMIAFCSLMFLDWFLQYKEIRESTNLRRFITGSLCGYAFGSTVLWALKKLLY